jgi:hypothetical protein
MFIFYRNINLKVIRIYVESSILKIRILFVVKTSDALSWKKLNRT